jgi:OmpA-OmpF porin, OOP family
MLYQYKTLKNRIIVKAKKIFRAAAMIPVLLCCGFLSARAQHFKAGYYNQGEKLYQEQQYYEATQCYEKYLANEKKARPRSEPFSVAKKVKGKTNLDPHQEAVYHLADSYRMIHDYVNAEKYYKQAVKFSPAAYPAAQYWYAVSLRANKKYADAMTAITAFLSTHTQLDGLLTDADRELENLRFIQSQGENLREPFVLTPMADSLAKSAYALSVEQGDTVVFTSIHSEPAKDGKLFYYNSLFESADAEDPLRHGNRLSALETPGQHNGLASFSKDGKRLFFTRWTNENGKTAAAIYTSVKTDRGWSVPVMAETPINQEGSNSSQPYLTEDSRFLLFSSDRPGGYGGYDLWFAVLDTGYYPMAAENLGAVINTTGDDEAPYFHDKSRTLVFSTNGRTGMGGFDIFYSRGNFSFSGWERPQNAGSPVNSSKDDMYYRSSDDDNLWNTGWLSSDRSSNCCLALFTVRQNNGQFVTGTVVDCHSQQGQAGVRITVTDLHHAGRLLAKFNTDSSGHYAFELHNSGHFKITADKEGYVSKENEYRLQLRSGQDTVSNETVCIDPVATADQKLRDLLTTLGRSSKVGNFGYKKAVLNDSAHDNLDSLAVLLKKSPSLVIQVEGYTDGIGGTAYNLRLAQKRVNACIRYLVKKGVPTSQLVGKAFGKCCPLVPETTDGRDDPAAREQNRRVEYKVLSGSIGH